MKIKITKIASGKSIANFDCPGCGLALESEMSETGGHGFCPDCGVKFKLPGLGAKGALSPKGDEALQALQQVVKTIDPPKPTKAPKKETPAKSGSRQSPPGKSLRPKPEKIQEFRPPIHDRSDHTFDSLPAPERAPERALEPASEPETKDCPYCGEKINVKATKCRFCRELLDDDAAPSASKEPNAPSFQPRTRDHEPPSVPPPSIRHLYYIVKAGKRFGPLAKSQLLELALKNEINILTLAWRPGMATWLKIVDISELEPLFSSIPPPLPKDHDHD